jgi:zinc-ribbon domain
MFCPRCAAQNQDHMKFCRSCGTDLRSVALALDVQLATSTEAGNAEAKKLELTQQWLKLQSDGIRGVVQGVLIFGASVLLGVALALFSNNKDWMIIWLIFCGWLVVWAAFILGAGFSHLIQSRMMRRGIDRLAGAMTASGVPAAGETKRIAETEPTPEVSTPLSVSEHTTSPLPKPHPRP